MSLVSGILVFLSPPEIWRPIVARSGLRYPAQGTGNHSGDMCSGGLGLLIEFSCPTCPTCPICPDPKLGQRRSSFENHNCPVTVQPVQPVHSVHSVQPAPVSCASGRALRIGVRSRLLTYAQDMVSGMSRMPLSNLCRPVLNALILKTSQTEP